MGIYDFSTTQARVRVENRGTLAQVAVEGVKFCTAKLPTPVPTPSPLPAPDKTVVPSPSIGPGGCLASPPPYITLTGIIRDFMSTGPKAHPDFEATIITEKGIVADILGANSKPVYQGGPIGGATSKSTHGAANFNEWYNDGPRSQKKLHSITLSKTAANTWSYSNSSFFPIDGQLQGNQGNSHNYHFTYELHTSFTYLGGERFKFVGDDDVWVYINN